MNALLLAGALTLGADPGGGLKPDLVKEIQDWKEGSLPPSRLLRFPDGNFPTTFPPGFGLCGMSALGDKVEDYIAAITDTRLLQALVFDRRADARCYSAAVRQWLSASGVHEVRTTLTRRRKTHPAEFFNRSDLATLAQVLACPYLEVKVASFDKKDMPKELAELSLNGLKADLVVGVPWQQAYRKAADSVPDTERSKKESGGSRTFLCYQYAGLLSPIGYDPQSNRIWERLQPDHIRKLFEAKGGTHVFETADAYWLYHVEKYYD